jgi:hypothetical protein
MSIWYNYISEKSDMKIMDEFEIEIKKEFLNEENSFMELEGASDSKSLLAKNFRLAHKLNGEIGLSHDPARHFIKAVIQTEQELVMMIQAG